MSTTRLAWVGWWLFVVSAILFCWSAIRAGDWVAGAGAGAFFIANLCFMAALRREGARSADDASR